MLFEHNIRAAKGKLNLIFNRNASIVECRHNDISAEFAIFNPSDVVQSWQAAGVFYEFVELELMSNYFSGGIFVDIGGNVGNHAIFFALQKNCTKVITFEPNPIALRILNTNLALNKLQDKVEVRPYGLGRIESTATLKTPKHNLGGASISEIDLEDHSNPSADANDIVVKVGDHVLEGIVPALIKIDIEGFEFECLQGLQKTILTHKPILFIELDDKNVNQMEQFFIQIGYEIVARPSRYGTSTNIIAKSKN